MRGMITAKRLRELLAALPNDAKLQGEGTTLTVRYGDANGCIPTGSDWGVEEIDSNLASFAKYYDLSRLQTTEVERITVAASKLEVKVSVLVFEHEDPDDVVERLMGAVTQSVYLTLESAQQGESSQ
jgi:hypothetical protein